MGLFCCEARAEAVGCFEGQRLHDPVGSFHLLCHAWHCLSIQASSAHFVVTYLSSSDLGMHAMFSMLASAQFECIMRPFTGVF